MVGWPPLCSDALPGPQLQAVSDIAKKHNIKHCCDSTFATPLMLLPIELGCDMTLHSTTKCVRRPVFSCLFVTSC